MKKQIYAPEAALALLLILGAISFASSGSFDVFKFLTGKTQVAAISGAGSGLIAQWNFDEGSGTAVADSSGSGNSATLKNSPSWTSGKSGGRVSFGGSESKMSGPRDLIGTGAVTVCTWYNANAWAFNSTLVSNGAFSLALTINNRFSLTSDGTHDFLTTMDAFKIGTWSHVCATRDSSGAGSIYIDGSLNASGNTGTPQGITNITIGNHPWKIYPWNGAVDNVRVYNRVLTSSEIQQIYTEDSGTVSATIPPAPTVPVQPTVPVVTTPTIPVVPTNPTVPVEPVTPPVTIAPTTSYASSCTVTDIEAALNKAALNAVVVVPSGTCTWTRTLHINKNAPKKNITLMGSGIDKTIIKDEVARGGGLSNESIISMYVSSSSIVRVTGFTFESSSTTIPTQWNGAVMAFGSNDAPAFRIDHNKFNISPAVARAIQINDSLGVIDHNAFIVGNQAITVYAFAWGGQGYGDGSWASPLSLGTNKAVYIEDNTFSNPNGTGAIDAFAGGRYVVRNNVFTDGFVANHGTETSGRMRGAFSFEIYNNTFKLATQWGQYASIDLRGGTGVIFNNTLTGNYSGFARVNSYRLRNAFPHFGSCDGTNPFDLNDSTIYDTGTAALSVTSGGLLTVSGKSWTPHQWKGYSIINITKKWSGQIADNTANTISVDENDNRGFVHTWSVGDQYKVTRAIACIDQIGRSTGSLIPSTGTPTAWSGQKLEPLYIWGNVRNGVSDNNTSSTGYSVQQGRDYIVGTARPGYTPYTYPHPMTLK